MLPQSATDSDLTDIYLNENLQDYYFKFAAEVIIVIVCSWIAEEWKKSAKQTSKLHTSQVPE